MSATKPTWTTDIHRLFTDRCWMEPLQQALRASGWLDRMENRSVDLRQAESVRQWSMVIYQHLANQPAFSSPACTSFRLEDALEIFRRWVNQGWRLDPSAPVKMAERIALGQPPLPPLAHPWQGHASLYSHGRQPFSVRHPDLPLGLPGFSPAPAQEHAKRA